MLSRRLHDRHWSTLLFCHGLWCRVVVRCRLRGLSLCSLVLLEKLRAHLSDQRTLFSGETMKQAMNSLWPRRACCEIRSVRSEAVGTLLGGSTAVTGVVSLSAAFASCLSIACMSRVVIPAVLALLGRVGSFDQPG